jgi:putative nucleotidyltransferase with HDIG domain
MPAQRPKDLIRKNLSIPTLPAVVQRISAMIEDPTNGTAEIGAVVALDAPLAAKVLRIANSAYYGLNQRCLSAEQASAVLGVRVLKNVVTQAAVIQNYSHLEKYSDFDADGMWRHSTMVAHACHLLAQQCSSRISITPSECHMCGLLHDIGKFVMLDSLGSAYMDCYRSSKELDLALNVLETAEFGFNHTDVGALVANHWNLPLEVVNAIQYHHGPREHVAYDPIVTLVSQANLICHRLANGEFDEARAVLDEETIRFLGIDEGGIPELLASITDSPEPEE